MIFGVLGASGDGLEAVLEWSWGGFRRLEALWGTGDFLGSYWDDFEFVFDHLEAILEFTTRNCDSGHTI